MKPIIDLPRSIVPACDIDSLADLRKLVSATHEIPGIGGYKIGFQLGLGFGLPKVVEVVRRDCRCTLPLIYDHQKAATDIPDTGKLFAKTLKESGIDAIILFPQAGPKTEQAWIEACFEQELGVMVGGQMTHAGYLRSDGGYIADEAILEMYQVAARCGVQEFVVPGNNLEAIKRIRQAIEALGVRPIFHAPGFVAQGGKVSAMHEVAGDKWHAIVGRGIYAAKDPAEAARALCAELR